jgi:phosphoglycolate phosphatase-like HAD superfamily hydrolase
MSPRHHISHVIFDFDGTLSWLRHGWPGIMADLFGEFVPSAPGESREALKERLLEDLLSLNGQPPIHQMHRCVERTRERGGLVPDPEALLHEYLRRLEAVIRERTERIRTGQADSDEFVVHGARDMIEQLERCGLSLIILSGGLQERVREEAELLGLARYFGAHIYGSASHQDGWSKKSVLVRLLREEKIEGNRLLSFGDGPVELEITNAAGGLAVGVASDENHNGSGRLDPHKRKLLLAAGADLMIPDYRDSQALLESILGK